MTDNMKKFLEAASQDREYLDKLNKAESLEAVTALAAEKGFILTEEDLKKPETAEGAVDDDELDTVAGGDFCACVGGGYGDETGNTYKECYCPIYGEGCTSSGQRRCYCIGGGMGDDAEMGF